MSVLRHKHIQDFTVVPNAMLNDKRLSMRDIGLLAFMLHLPEGWEFSISGLAAILPNDGRDAISVSLKRIENAGYLRRVKERDQNGRIGGVDWCISDTPMDGSPGTDLPYTGKPYPDLPYPDLPYTDLPYTENPSQRKKKYNKEHIEQRKEEENTVGGFRREPENPFLGEESRQKPSDKPPRTRFIPPTVEEVAEYCRERKNNVDPQRFIDYYTSNGWMVGKNKMKDWKAAVRTWEKNGYSNSSNAGTAGNSGQQQKFSKTIRTEQEYYEGWDQIF